MTDLSVKCIRCGHLIELKDVKEGKSKHQCPDCGLEFETDHDPSRKPIGSTQCPNCGAEIPIWTNDRPYRTFCDKCHERFVV
jgi:predicted RNA-binding Zn-ribbon protein involved in translation (DUF1610 family)